MSYTALYRKWRPLVFEDVVEQEHVVRTIKNTVKSDRIGHAYLFCGTRGTGKTTMAKIFARAINCLDPKDGDPCNQCEICRGILSDSVLDVVEIDAASNNSVDNVREIRDEVIYAPSQAKYKVYIIDEVHMLSSGAFNALLKTLEEPPSHVVFVLATTDPHKLPATILSRCQRFDFKKISIGSIAERVKMVADASRIAIEEEAALLIAKLADGALRDALSILDQCIAVGSDTVAHQNVLDAVGIVSDDFLADIVDNINNRDIEGLVGDIERLSADGRDILRFASDLVMYFRNLLICKLSKSPRDIIDVGKSYLERMEGQAEAFSIERIISIIKELSSFESQLKYALNQRVFLEVMLISISSGTFGQSSESNHVDSGLLDRILQLESAMKAGVHIHSAANQPGLPSSPESLSSPAAPPTQSGGRVFDARLPVPADAPKENKKGSHKELEIWADVKTDLKAGGRMMLFTYLASTKAVAADDSTVLVVFPPEVSSLKESVSRIDNIEVLQNALQKRLGRQVRVKLVDEEMLEDLVQTEDTQEKEPGQENRLLKLSREISDKLNVPLDIIDE